MTQETPAPDMGVDTAPQGGDDHPSNPNADTGGSEGADGQPKKKRRRRRGRRGGRKPEGAAGAEGSEAGGEAGAADAGPAKATEAPAQERRPRREGGEAGGGRGGRGEGRGGRSEGRGEGRGGGRREEGGEGGGPRKRSRSKRSDASDREPERFRQEKTASFSPESFALDTTFADLGLKPELVEGLTEAGFVHPTHIQAQLIPLTLTGKDVLGQAKTGTGKTLAFGLPIMSMIEPGVPFQVLILAPTRELAIQIRQDLDEVGGPLGVQTAAVYGGQSINVQADRLGEGPEVIVGTPGRVMDMVGRGHMTFSNVRFAVLDEVDRMFDFGFRDDMKKILSACPRHRQTVFVSATMTPEVETLARRYMNEPEKLIVSSGSLTVDLVKQEYVTCQPWDKKRMLAHVLTHEEPAVTLVFCRMKRTVDSLVRFLEKHRIDAHAIHGDMTQSARNTVMERFRSGSLSVLVASDLASRGIDVEGITHVINYDLPDDPDLYVHRIGRTARAGREGVAWSLVTPDQGKLLTEIEHLINAEIPHKQYPDFEASERPEGFRDEPTGGRPIYKVEGVEEEKKSRFEGPDLAAIKELDEEDMESKFPGGIVPGKRPPKMMRGRTKTRGR